MLLGTLTPACTRHGMTQQLKDWLSFVRLALCFGTIHFIIWAASGFFEISLLIGKGTLNIFSLLTAAYFMLSLVRIWTTLRLAWPRFVFVMQLLAQLFTFLLTLLHIPGHVLSFFMELV